MKVLVVGTGRVAFNLCHAIARSSLDLIGVAGRDPIQRQELAERSSTKAFAIEDVIPEADLILIAVKDDAIGTVAGSIPRSGAVVAHTSGSTSMGQLDPHSERGVFWPIQTFIQEQPADLKTVPIVIEGNTTRSADLLMKLGKELGQKVIQVDQEQRAQLHLAAVLTSNFPVALLQLAQDLLKEQKLPPDLLMPLWNSTVNNIMAMGADDALTGPAKRHDHGTIQKHLALLQDDPMMQDAYRLLSALIMRRSVH